VADWFHATRALRERLCRNRLQKGSAFPFNPFKDERLRRGGGASIRISRGRKAIGFPQGLRHSRLLALQIPKEVRVLTLKFAQKSNASFGCSVFWSRRDQMFIAPATQKNLRSGGAKCLNLLEIDGAPMKRKRLSSHGL
jgi:hypothetical protein